MGYRDEKSGLAGTAQTKARQQLNKLSDRPERCSPGVCLPQTTTTVPSVGFALAFCRQPSTEDPPKLRVNNEV